MKVLIVSHKPPYPTNDGGSLAIYNLTLGLKQAKIDVELLCIETEKHPFLSDYKTEIPFNIESCYLDTKIKPVNAINALLKNESYNITRFYNEDFRKKLITKLNGKKYDIIQLESLFVTPYIDTLRNNSKAKIVYRSHNVEYKIWEHLALGEKKFLKKSYLKKLSKQLKEYEYSILNKYNGAVFITDNDSKYYENVGSKKPHITIPFSLNTNKYKPHLSNNKSICYLGSMDWLPNVEGIDWFINNVWHAIKTSSNIDFYLAGKSMPPKYFKNNSPQFHVIGEVHDAIEFISHHNIMIVPLFSGSGMRVKIVEAMALGKVVIGTPLAFQGIKGIENGKNAIIANHDTEFHDQIIEVSNNTELMQYISKNARALIEEKYSIKSNTEKLINFYNSLFNGAKS